MASAPADDRNILVSSHVRAADVASTGTAVATELRATLARTGGGSVASTLAVSWLEPLESDAEPPAGVSGLISYVGLEDRAALVAGAWPREGQDPLEASLPEAAANALGLSVGDRLTIADRRDPSKPIEVEITGLWRRDADDPFWTWIAAREADATAAATQALVVREADLVEHAVSAVGIQWWASPSANALRLDRLDAAEQEIRSLRSRLDTVAGGSAFTIRTALPTILGEVGRSVLVTRAGILALGAQFAVLAVYAVILVASILVDRRRTEAALIRARGAGGWHLAAMAFGEALLLAVPVALVAPWIAIVLVRLLALGGPSGGSDLEAAVTASGAPFLAAAAAAGAGVIGLTVSAAFFNARPAGGAAAVRPGSRTAAQALGVDIALVAIAAVGVWQLRVYGAPLTRNARGVLGLDPLLVVAPALGLLAGVVLATRLFPRLAQLAEWRISRVRTAVAPLGARQLARRPLRYTRSALLLMLAIGLGTFAAVYTATWTRSQDDQAAYLAVGDARLMTSQYASLPEWAVGPAYRGVAGVAVAMPVVRQSLTLGRAVREGQLVAVDPDDLDALRARNADGSVIGSADLTALAAERPRPATLAIAGDPRRVAVTLDVDLEAGSTPPDWRGVAVAAVILDADGRPQRIAPADGGELLFRGDAQRVEIDLTTDDIGADVAVQAPASLLGIELRVTPDSADAPRGSVEIRAIETSEAASGGEWTPLALDGEAEMVWGRLGPNGAWEASGGGDGARLTLPGAGGSPAGPGPAGGTTAYRWWSPLEPTDRVAAIAGARFLELTGGRVGDRLTGITGGRAVTFEIVGATDEFAPVDPDAAFIVVDRSTLELGAFATTSQPTTAREWWLAIDGDPAPVLETLRDRAYGAEEVIGRAELSQRLTTDPVGLGVVGVLALGSLAAITFAAIGFVVSATISTTERVGELAILRALGLSTRQLTTWLALENAFLLVFGLAAGCGVGLLLGWLVLPSAPFTATGEPPVPAAAVVVPWLSLAPLFAVVGALLVVAIVVIRAQLPKIRISDVLRGRDE